MPACADQELLLGGLVDGELDAANTAMVEAHVARCEGCREELERLAGGAQPAAQRRRPRIARPTALSARIAALPELARPSAANDNRVARLARARR